MDRPVRRLLRSPGFSALAIAILALGLGAALAVFEVADAVLLRPLPFERPQDLVTAWHLNAGTQITVSGADFLDWRAQASGFEKMAAVSGRGFTLTGGAEPERVEGAIVSPDFFPLLGTPPLLGRAATPAGGQTAVLSETAWRTRFRSDPDIVGRTITLDGEPVQIAGVMPARFRFPPLADIWVSPRTQVPDHPTYPIDPEHDRARHYLTVLGRIAPGVSVTEAEASLRTVQARLTADHPVDDKDTGARIVPLGESLFGSARPLLLALLGVAALLLGVAWSNAAHLFLARALSRAHESAVRVALGASSAALWRMFFGEAFVLSATAGAIGLGVATVAAPLLVHMSPQGALLPLPELGPRVVVAAIVLVFLCGASLGLIMAWQPLRPISEGGRSSTGSRRQARLRAGFLAFEVALSLVLLVGSGLLVRSFAKLASVDPGFDAAGVLAADLPLAKAKHPDKAAQLRFAQESLQRLRAEPEIEAAGYVSRLPFSPQNTVGDLALPGHENEAFPCDLRLASDGYFEALRIPIREGRGFTEGDLRGDGPPAVIVNEAAARRAFPTGDAIGQRILVWGETSPSVVVGVVGNIHHLGLETQPRPEAFRPLGVVGWPNLMLVVRGRVPAAQLADPLRRAIWSLDRDQPIARLDSMQQRIGDSLKLRAFTLALLSVMAAVAALLAIAGIHGVTSYLVAQRTRELSVRMALGATPLRLVLAVARETLPSVIIGCALGLVAAGAAARVLRGFLFGVEPVDVATFAAAPLVLALAAMVAAILGARRAAKVDPASALRS